MFAKLIFSIIFFACVCSVNISAQETVSITLADLQNFRKAVADAVFWEKTAKDKEDQVKAANDSSASWKGLYLSEKDRADRVQEKRAVEATAAATDFQKANFELREQNTDLKREKRDLEDKIERLESSRKYYFGFGAATGGVLGFLGGRQTCGTAIPGLARSTNAETFERSSVERQFNIRRAETPNLMKPASDVFKIKF